MSVQPEEGTPRALYPKNHSSWPHQAGEDRAPELIG